MTPSIAYLRLDRMSERRQNCRSSSRGWMIENKPHARISEIKRRQITPANRLEDPYIAAVLIGLAQQLRRDFEPPQAKCHNDRPSIDEVLSNPNIAPSTLQTAGIFSGDSGSEHMLGECLSFRVCFTSQRFREILIIELHRFMLLRMPVLWSWIGVSISTQPIFPPNFLTSLTNHQAILMPDILASHTVACLSKPHRHS